LAERTDKEFCTGGSDRSTRERKLKIFLLEAVARERLLKTQQAGKFSAGALVNCKVLISAVAL
jgi:hypothetical protein